MNENSISQIRLKTRLFMKNNKLIVLGIIFIFELILIAFSLLAFFIKGSDLKKIYLIIVNCILVIPLQIGVIYIYLNYFKNHIIRKRDLFYFLKAKNKGQKYLTGIIYLIIKGIISFFITITFISIFEGIYNAIFGSMILEVMSAILFGNIFTVLYELVLIIILGIILFFMLSIIYNYLNIRFYMSLFLALDVEGKKSYEYIIKSFKMTKHEFKEIFKYYMALISNCIIYYLIFIIVMIALIVLNRMFINLYFRIFSMIFGMVVFIFMSMYVFAITFYNNTLFYWNLRGDGEEPVLLAEPEKIIKKITPPFIIENTVDNKNKK